MTLFSKLLAAREFPLPPFDLAPLAFELLSTVDEDELLLDRVVLAADGQPNVVTLSQPVPTAGELHDSIERHLSGSEGTPEQVPDGVEELRAALADLRRSLG